MGLKQLFLLLAGLALISLASPSYASEQQQILLERFVELHQAYLEAEGTEYTSLLRATLRHARRLEPAQCVLFQRQLIEIGNSIGYDGLEPVWLVYQDCAAAGEESSFGPQRLKNTELFQKGLRFAREPLPQLPLRVTYWNSTIERGTRGDAVRLLLTQFSAASLAQAQGWNLHQLLNQPAINKSLCSLPTLVNQFGQVALPELVRLAQCLTGAGPNVQDICSRLFPEEGGSGPEPGAGDDFGGISPEDVGRLKEFCGDLTGGGTAPAAGIDDLDAYSEDQCNSEESTRLYETAKIIDLVLDCYFSEQGNPRASGATSANYDQILNKVVTWERSNNRHVASLMTGKALDDPGRNFDSAEGSTPEEARQNLLDKIVNDPPDGYTVTENPDGSVTVEGSHDVENEDGSHSEVTESHTFDAEGNQSSNTQVINEDGSGHGGTSNQKADGSSSSVTIEWDADGNTTKVTKTTTDKDGNTTTETTTNSYDADGNLTGTSTSTSTGTSSPAEPGEFDPRNSACQELMNLDVMPGGGGSKFWNDLFNRPYKSDPRTVYPSPDEASWTDEPFCGAAGLGNNNTRSRCRTPVLCAPDTYLDDSCQCQQVTGGPVTLRGCIVVTCQEGETPVPVGANACICQPATGAPTQPPGPRPGPDPALGFSELIWNRPVGEIFVTDEMVERRN